MKKILQKNLGAVTFSVKRNVLKCNGLWRIQKIMCYFKRVTCIALLVMGVTFCIPMSTLNIVWSIYSRK